MELEELKARWLKENVENIQSNKQNMEQLQLLLKQKTSETLLDVRNRYKGIITYLLLGLLLNIAISPFLHFLLGEEGPVFRITMAGMAGLMTTLIVGLLVLYFYWMRFLRIPMDTSDADIRTFIVEKISLLRRYLLQEVLFITGLFVSLFLAARGWSVFLGNGAFGDIFHGDILVALVIGLCVMAFYVGKRIRAYQNHIKQLRNYLSSLDEA